MLGACIYHASVALRSLRPVWGVKSGSRGGLTNSAKEIRILTLDVVVSPMVWRSKKWEAICYSYLFTTVFSTRNWLLTVMMLLSAMSLTLSHAAGRHHTRHSNQRIMRLSNTKRAHVLIPDP